MPSTATTSKVSSLATDLFYDAVKKYVDYNKPDSIAQRQLESWKMNWTEGSGQSIAADGRGGDDNDDEDSGNVNWSPTDGIEGILEICGDYVAVTIKMECAWTDGDVENNSKKEDGRLSYTCRVRSARFLEKKDDEEKTERKIRKKMISRLRQDSYIAKLLDLEENSTTVCLAQASIYVNAAKFELEERVDVSEIVAEALRRALWSSTITSLDMVEVILALPSLPCRSAATPTTKTKTTRLANRAKLRLLEDAMMDECEKEGDDQLIQDLNISKASGPEDDQKETNNDAPTRRKKKSKR